MKKGKFIVICGVEGSGKGTQINLIKEHFKGNDNIVFTREPGGTDIAEKIRDIILNEDIDPLTEAYLFAAARREHIIKKIKPSLEEGKTIICDRFVYSSLVYQGLGRNLGINFIDRLNKPVIEGFYPDKIIYLDLEPEIGLERIKKNNREINRLDNEKLDFYKKCREGFLHLANNEPDKFIIINANQSERKVFQDIKNNLKDLF
ncbi:MAG: dTMP kinase [Clostridiales bacterium]|nr:dTMP kinase [Clostridiales bacterium]